MLSRNSSAKLSNTIGDIEGGLTASEPEDKKRSAVVLIKKAKRGGRGLLLTGSAVVLTLGGALTIGSLHLLQHGDVQQQLLLQTEGLPSPHDQEAPSTPDGILSREAMIGIAVTVVLSLVGVYYYFFMGVNDTVEAKEVRLKKAKLALAQMAQTLVMEQERLDQVARMKTNGGQLPAGEDRKAPTDSKALFEMLYDTVEERHLTEMGVEAMGVDGVGTEYQEVRELFRVRFAEDLRELHSKTKRADTKSFANEVEANALVKYQGGAELREMVRLSETKICLNFSKPLTTDLRTYPPVVTEEVRAIIKECRKYSDEFGPGRGQSGGKYGAIFAVLRPQVPMYALGMFFFLVESFVGPAMWARMFTVFDKLQDHTTEMDQFFWLLVSFFFKWVFFVLMHVVGLSLMNKANSQFSLKIRTAIMSSMMRQDVEFFDRTPSGVLQERMTKDSGDLSQNLLEEPRHFLRCVAVIVSNLYVLYGISPKLLFWAFLPVPVVAYVQYQAVKSRRRTNLRMRNMSDQAAADTAEIIKEIRTVREFAKELNEASKFKAMSSYRASIEELATAIMHVGFGWPLFIVFMTNRLQAMYNAGEGVYDGQFSVGVAIQFSIGVGMICDHLRGIIDIVPKLMKIENPMTRVNELLLTKGRIEPQVGDPLKLTDVGGALEFRNVDFSVPDKKILSSMSFTVEPGTTVGICGSAGSGKSTVMNLIKRFYNPTGGEILLGGRQVSAYDLASYRRHISVVGQENVLFSTTIRENIIYGLTEEEKAAPDIDARIEQACRDASIWHDIMTLFPRKLESYVGEKGFKMSGGQKQRLAIARAMIRQSSFLMLDEPTAALDSVNEKVVQEALENMRMQNQQGCTLMIAHRLTTIKNCDKIMVFDHGTKVEEGAHDELLKIPIVKEKRESPIPGKPDLEVTTSGFYRELWETQNGVSDAADKTKTKVMESWVRHLEAQVKDLEAKLTAPRNKENRYLSPGGRRLQYGEQQDALVDISSAMSYHQQQSMTIMNMELGAVPSPSRVPKLSRGGGGSLPW